MDGSDLDKSGLIDYDEFLAACMHESKINTVGAVCAQAGRGRADGACARWLGTPAACLAAHGARNPNLNPYPGPLPFPLSSHHTDPPAAGLRRWFGLAQPSPHAPACPLCAMVRAAIGTPHHCAPWCVRP